MGELIEHKDRRVCFKLAIVFQKGDDASFRQGKMLPTIALFKVDSLPLIGILRTWTSFSSFG
jgi:hypothetical protein